MNILIFSNFSGSAKHGMVFRSYLLAVEWLQVGHSVTIVSNSFSHTRKVQPECKGLYTTEYIDGIRYIWVKGPVYDQSSALGRVRSMLSFTFKLMLFKLPINLKFDAVMCSSPHPFTIFPAYKVAKKSKAKLIYDVRDLWPLTLKLLGGISKYHPFIVLMQMAENFAYKNSNLVTAVPQNSESYMRDHGLNAPFIHLPNFASPIKEKVSIPAAHHDKLYSLKQKYDLVVGYCGALGLANSIDTLVKAVSLSNSNVAVVCIGDGNEKEALVEQASSLGLDDAVIFLPSLNKNQVADFLSYVDICYVAGKKSELYKYGASPTKVNDYFLARKPVLYGVCDQGNPIELSGAGICFEAESAPSLATTIDTLSELDISSLGDIGYRWVVKNQLASVHANKVIRAIEALG